MFFTYLIYVYVMLLCVYGAERYVYFTFPGLYGNVTRTLHKCVILYTAYPEIYTFPWSCKRVFSCQILHTYILLTGTYIVPPLTTIPKILEHPERLRKHSKPQYM